MPAQARMVGGRSSHYSSIEIRRIVFIIWARLAYATWNRFRVASQTFMFATARNLLRAGELLADM
jgi:hypothetical protein